MKSVEITAGKRGRIFDKVRLVHTLGVDENRQIWLPESEAALYGSYTALNVFKEGVYTAPMDGYARVTVTVPPTTSVTGTENGQTVTYTVGDDGYLDIEITEEEVPQ